MNFKFYPVESRIYDFLKFPRLIYFREGVEETDDKFNDLPMDDYINFVKKVEKKLEPYREEIEKFYMKHFFHDYDFIDLISRRYTIFGYQNAKEYLDMLLSLKEEEINQALIYSFMSINEEHQSYSNDMIDRAKMINSDKEGLISFIKDLPIEAGAKWNLFLIVEDPTKYMKIYVNLMDKILKVFEELYEPYEPQIIKYGKGLVELLNKEGSKGLEDISYSIIKPSVIDSEETNILISATFSYAITIYTVLENNFIAWGLKMEEAFKAMKEINENKTNERVQIFKNLGDKTRYEVLKLIASGETSTKEIANRLGVSSATISYHINNLLTSKIIKMDKIEERYGYVLDHEFINEAIKDFLEDIKSP